MECSISFDGEYCEMFGGWHLFTVRMSASEVIIFNKIVKLLDFLA